MLNAVKQQCKKETPLRGRFSLQRKKQKDWINSKRLIGKARKKNNTLHAAYTRGQTGQTTGPIAVTTGISGNVNRNGKGNVKNSG